MLSEMLKSGYRLEEMDGEVVVRKGSFTFKLVETAREHPLAVAGFFKNGTSYSNTLENKFPSRCIESMLAFKCNSVPREALRKVIERYGGVEKPDFRFLPGVFIEPGKRRNCVGNLTRRLIKLGFNPVLNLPGLDCFPNPDSEEFKRVGFASYDLASGHKVALFQLGLDEEYSIKDIMKARVGDEKREFDLLSLRFHLLASALFELVINMPPSDYDERVRVLYAVPYYTYPGDYRAMLIGLNKRGSNTVFNRVVYFKFRPDKVFGESMFLVAGNSFNWLPAGDYKEIETFVKGASVMLKDLKSPGWGKRLKVVLVKNGKVVLKNFDLAVGHVKFGNNKFVHARFVGS